MRRSLIWVPLLLWSILPKMSAAQTRFFERGDSGFTPSFDLIAVQGYGNDFDWTWGAHASYTYKGLFDVGGGFKTDSYNQDPWFLLAKAVVIQPQSTAGLGLEITGRYTHSIDDRSSYDPVFVENRDRTYSTGLRGYYRNAPANLIVGLGGRYIFNKDQALDHSGEVLWGHDYGEMGFALDCHFLAWRLAHFSLEVEYAQNNRLKFLEDWQLSVVLSAGFMIGLNREPGGDANEP